MENFEVSIMPFPYKTGVVTRKQFDDHYTIYQGYVEKTNEIAGILESQPEYTDANAYAGCYRGWKKDEAYAINGVILHELYFQNLGSEESPPGTKVQHLMDKFFGGLANWKEDFTACAKAARGWCVFAYEQRTGACRNILLDTHDEGNIAASYPIIVLDVYEHAYFSDYGTDKAAYINRFINNIPWDAVEKRAAVVI